MERVPRELVVSETFRDRANKDVALPIGHQQTFSPEHAGFSPATYELVLMVTLTDTPGEGESHYEHNELITKSSSSRRAFLEGGALMEQSAQLSQWLYEE